MITTQKKNNYEGEKGGGRGRRSRRIWGDGRQDRREG
jgi:hypothetical protein